jgi:sigma-B regulation protein RsbU (phosphoserine phosphatase)
MLPPRGELFAAREELRVAGLMDPAEDIGGDLYDAFPSADGRLVLAIGDVSGKGIPAALFMARAVALLRGEALRERAPDRLLARMNAALCEHNDTGMFVTLLVAFYDPRTGVLEYANGGHLAPAHVTVSGWCGWLPLAPGLALGMSEEASYRTSTAQLSPGERVLLYTDGLTEAEDESGNFYGEARGLESLRRAARSDDWVERVREDLRVFVGRARQSDDITLLGLERRA